MMMPRPVMIPVAIVIIPFPSNGIAQNTGCGNSCDGHARIDRLARIPISIIRCMASDRGNREGAQE